MWVTTFEPLYYKRELLQGEGAFLMEHTVCWIFEIFQIHHPPLARMKEQKNTMVLFEIFPEDFHPSFFQKIPVHQFTLTGDFMKPQLQCSYYTGWPKRCDSSIAAYCSLINNIINLVLADMCSFCQPFEDLNKIEWTWTWTEICYWPKSWKISL